MKAIVLAALCFATSALAESTVVAPVQEISGLNGTITGNVVKAYLQQNNLGSGTNVYSSFPYMNVVSNWIRSYQANAAVQGALKQNKLQAMYGTGPRVLIEYKFFGKAVTGVKLTQISDTGKKGSSKMYYYQYIGPIIRTINSGTSGAHMYQETDGTWHWSP